MKSSVRRTAALASAAIASLALVLGGVAPANAVLNDGEGWIRLAHLSPDTKAVDVRLTSLGGTTALYELEGVGYGAVSPYLSMPDGIYTISMVPSGSASTATPMIRTSVEISDGSAVTVAAYGKNEDITTKVFDDDLSMPSSGNARIRLIQASTITPTVDVATSTGLTIASAARAGSATTYAEVPAGPWDLELSGEGVVDAANVDLALGSVTTLFVLDTAAGGLTILPVLDSAAVGDVPVGSVATGGGWLDRGETRAIAHFSADRVAR